MRRAARWAVGLAAGVVLLAVGAVVALTVALDAGALTPRLVAAIEQATGRAATLGAVSLRPGLTPLLAVRGVSLANIPGGSRPEMARIERMEASLALLPLLRGEVAFRRIAVSGADILLETLPDGTPNWVLAAPRAPGEPAAAPSAPRAPAARSRIAIGEVELTDSRVTLPDPRLGTVTLASARITGFGGAGPAHVVARVALHGAKLALEAEAAALPPPAGEPWALRATLAVAGNRISLEGMVGGPLTVAARLPEPRALAPLLAAFTPQVPALPPLEGTLRLAPDFRPLGLEARLGALDLGGLALTSLAVAAPALDRPAEVTAEGTRAGQPFRAALTLDPPGALLPWQPETPIAVTLTAEAGGARAEARGRILRPRSAGGATFDLRATVPDLAALVPGAPALREAAIAARIAAEGPPGGALRVAPFSIAAPALQAEGELTLTPGAPFGIEGRIAVARADLDALGRRPAAAMPATPPAAAPEAAAAPPTDAPAAPPPAADRRVIPDLPLPLDAARAWRGRVEASAAELVSGGAAWRDLAGVLTARDGTLHVEAFSVVTPGGPLRGQGRLDALADPPALALALRSEGRGLDLAALRRARGEAAGLEGRAEIALDLAGRGRTTREVAATLTGDAGLAMVGGRLAGTGLLRLGPDLVRLLLPGAPREGLALRCLALRLTAEDGLAHTRALLMETQAGRVEGSAAVNLRDETLAARLLPDVSLFGVTVRAPVGVGGTLAAPRVGVDAARALGQVMGDTAANRLWRDPTVEWLRGRATGAHPAGDCAAQLRLARMGAEGAPPPPSPAPVPGVPRELQGPAQDILRGLGGVLGGGRR